MGSAKTRRGMTSEVDRDPPRPKVYARKCHPGIHSRSRPRPNSSVSLSTAPRLSVRSLSRRGPLTSNPSSDPETSPAFSRFSRQPLAIASERARVDCNNELSYVSNLFPDGVTKFTLNSRSGSQFITELSFREAKFVVTSYDIAT